MRPSQVGGYSFISTPADLERTGAFQLAVKRSGYPPAVWLHDKARRLAPSPCLPRCLRPAFSALISSVSSRHMFPPPPCELPAS